MRNYGISLLETLKNLSGRLLSTFQFILLIGITVAMMTGCASLEGKFGGTEKENIGFFADQTIAMLASARLDFSRDEAIYVREFSDPDGAEEKRLAELLNEARIRGRNMIHYAVTVVTIAESDLTEEEKIKAYADFAEKFRDRVVNEVKTIDAVAFDTLIADIRVSEKLLDAFQVVQPVINLGGRNDIRLMDEIHDAVEALALKIDERIDERYEEVIRFQEAIEEEKYRVLRSLPLIYRANRGDMEAFRELVNSEVITRKSLIPKGRPTEDDLIAIGKHLFDRLDVIARVQEEIKPDWDTYRATHRELDTLVDKFIGQQNRMRLMTLIWVRAHQKMAAGVINPAEWFDLKQAPGQLLNVGVRAIL